MNPRNIPTSIHLSQIIDHLRREWHPRIKDVVGDKVNITVDDIPGVFMVNGMDRTGESEAAATEAIGKITGVGTDTGAYTATEILPDGSVPASARVWDGTDLPEVYDLNKLDGVLLVGARVTIKVSPDENGDDYYWCESGVQIGDAFAVVVAMTSGAAGSATTQCGFIYTVKDLDDNVLATSVDPITAPHTFLRPTLGPFVEATSGLACYVVSGDGHVLSVRWVNEAMDPEACS